MLFNLLPPLSSKSSKESATMICTGVYVFLIIEALIPPMKSLVCEKPAYFNTHQGSRLLNSVIDKIAVDAVHDCLNKCTDKSELCQSINYYHGNNDINQCYLNNRTRRSAAAEDFESNPEFTYYEKDPCVPNPCLFEGTCSKDNSNMGFLCSCAPKYKGSHCEIERVGGSSHKPGKSCKDIKSNGDGVYDGKYWIDPENSGNAMQVYCDMSQEGGGWLLVSNVILPNPASIPSLTLRTSYRDIANYNDNTTILSPTTLSQIRQLTGFTQLRFYCRIASVGRTVHMITATDSKGKAVVDYFTASSGSPPQACGSFYRGTGDTSKLAAHCSLWKDGGVWSSSSRSSSTWKLHDHTFYVPNQYHWITRSSVQCDSQITSGRSPGDFWKICVR